MLGARQLCSSKCKPDRSMIACSIMLVIPREEARDQVYAAHTEGHCGLLFAGSRRTRPAC